MKANRTLILNALLIFILFVSCSSPSDSTNDSPTSEQIKIIGKPIRIGNIEVAQYDFPKTMSWYDADESCKGLGDGWRLPTKDELNFMYENKNEIGGFRSGDYYWSSSMSDGDHGWIQLFRDGYQDELSLRFKEFVRAIRTF